MFYKRILLLIALITTLTVGNTVINAMSVDNVLFKGLLIDENSNKPIGAEVRFEDSEGDDDSQNDSFNLEEEVTFEKLCISMLNAQNWVSLEQVARRHL